MSSPYFIFGHVKCLSGHTIATIPLSFVFNGLKKEDYEVAYTEFVNQFFENSNVSKVQFTATHSFDVEGLHELKEKIIFDEIFRIQEEVTDRVSNNV